MQSSIFEMVNKKNILLKAGIGATAAVGIAAVALPLAGFTAAGVAAGSAAAAWQSSIGSVAAGSLFASLQSAGVLGFAATTNLGLAAGGAVVANADTIVKKVATKFKESEKPSEEKSDSHFGADSDQSNGCSGLNNNAEKNFILSEKRSDIFIVDNETIKHGWDLEDEDIELPDELEYTSATSQHKYFIAAYYDIPKPQVRLYNSKFLEDHPSKNKVPSTRCKLNTFNEKIYDCHQLTTSGNFEEAIEKFRMLLLSIPLATEIGKLEKAEARQLSEMCREYILGLSMELERKSLPKETLEQQKRNCEMAAYFTHCSLDPVHQILALRIAINLSFKLKNYKTAGSLARHLLELGPNKEVERRTRMILKACEKNPVDEHSLMYNEDKSFSICGRSYKPIYEEDLKLKCSLCQTNYFPEFHGHICNVCGVTQIGV